MAEVTLRDLVSKVPAEADDVCQLAADFAKTIKDGGSVAGLVPALVKAVDGISQVLPAIQTRPLACLKSVFCRGLDIVSTLTGLL